MKLHARALQDGIVEAVKYQPGGVDSIGGRDRDARWMDQEAQARGRRRKNLKTRARTTVRIACNRVVGTRCDHVRAQNLQILAQLDGSSYDLARTQ